MARLEASRSTAFPALEEREGFDSRPLATLRRTPWIAALNAVLAVGLLLRLPALRTAVLGYEEAGYALDAWRLLTGNGGPGQYYRAAPGYSQALGLFISTLGSLDASVRLLGVLAGLGTALFCLPLSRTIGRDAALLAALLFAVSPFWVNVSSVASPDAPAAFLAVLAAALAASRHKWPWALVAGAGVAGYALSFGVAGMWLGAGAFLFLVWVGRSYWTPLRAGWCLAAFVLFALAGQTSFFVRLSAAQGAVGSSSARTAGPLDVLREVVLSAPALTVAVGVAVLAVALAGRRGEFPRWNPVLIAVAIVGALLALAWVLPAGYRPPPVAPALVLTFAAAIALARGLHAVVGAANALAVGSAAVLLAAALSAVLPGSGSQGTLVSAPDGIRRTEAAPMGVREAMDRVRRVSSELYVLDRTLDEPRGGRRLSVELSPAVANWGMWYLRDLENVRVWPEVGRTPEVQVLVDGQEPRPASGTVRESMTGDLALAWSAPTWRKISPEAGAELVKPKDSYNLLDHAPPGSRPGQLDSPVDAAIDPAGNVYVVDQKNSRVQKYARNGKFLLQWGSVGQGDGQFADAGEVLGPTGIAATNEYVWVADTWNHRIQQFRPDGAFVRAWGTFADTKGDPTLNRQFPRSFYGPRGIAVGGDGLLYITDTGNKRVVVYDRRGEFIRQWGVGGSGEAELDEPIGIAIDKKSGSVYVADTRNGRIQVFTTRGKHLRSWQVDEWSGEGRLEPYIDTDAQGNVYVVDPIQKAVYKYAPDGTKLDTRTGDGTVNMLLPLGIAVSPSSRVYVVDAGLSRVLDLGGAR